jgi:signal peptidase I
MSTEEAPHGREPPTPEPWPSAGHESFAPEGEGDRPTAGPQIPDSRSAPPPLLPNQLSGELGSATAGPTGSATATLGLPEERAKPFLARVLNNLGIRTSPAAEWYLDWVQVLTVAGMLALLVMNFVIVRMRVPTGSMEPTIMPNDSFFVDKISFYLRRPQPGDIIVFWHRENTGEQVRYVKRLIAMSGQRVQIKNCYVYVDGEPLTDHAFNHPGHRHERRQCYTSSGQMQDPDPEKRDISKEWIVPSRARVKDGQCLEAGEGLPAEETVPAVCYFVLGDHTMNSLDSRYWGFVNEQDFIGEPFLKVWPLHQIGFMNGYFGSAR